jgi:hypothetical protein
MVDIGLATLSIGLETDVEEKREAIEQALAKYEHATGITLNLYERSHVLNMLLFEGQMGTYRYMTREERFRAERALAAVKTLLNE